jgi:hypothetical protein
MGDITVKEHQRTSETDPRFPSGAWTGFFLQPGTPGKHWMELHLTFQEGNMSGEGRDWVGTFSIRGSYQTGSGECHWTKKYTGKHDVYYRGFNEGKGIWGVWEFPSSSPGGRGGFHIWPEGMADPTGARLSEEEESPVTLEEQAPTKVPVALPGK